MLKADQRTSDGLYNNFADGRLRPRVLMAYEDLNMAVRAMNVLDLITREVGDNFDMHFSMWRFDFFNSPDMLEAAVRQAQWADIIIFAPKNSGGLASPVTSWLEQWAGRRQVRPGALVVVLDPATGLKVATSFVVTQLQATAQLTGMDFFFSALRQFVPARAGSRESPRAAGSTCIPVKPQLNVRSP